MDSGFESQLQEKYMRILSSVIPSPEQLVILNDSSPGERVIRGAAGSGKTTAALLRLRQLCKTRLKRRERMQTEDPVRVLVLTYNKTLRGYITELARSQVAGDPGLILEVSTFAKWARDLIGPMDILEHDQVSRILRGLLSGVLPDQSSMQYFVNEVEYALSMFLPEDLEDYLTVRREGRGTAPRVERPLRRRLLDEVIAPYQQRKLDLGKPDWNDLAVMAIDAEGPGYDVIIVDEAQDFSANQVRAILAHRTEDSSVTFIIDAVQRIYPRHFKWSEVGVTIRPNHTWRLSQNHRNTMQIAAFARPLVDGLPVDDDGSLPDFSACEGEGPLPQVVSGSYSKQIDYMLSELFDRVDLTSESVAILQPKGGGWFKYTREALRAAGVPFCELTQKSEWPTGPENIGLSTIHSAKGLEFDHVLLPGLNQEVTPHGNEEGDGSLEELRRLLAMGVGRARRSVMVGYKPGEESTLISLLDPETYEAIEL